jgi:hypothetical protein
MEKLLSMYVELPSLMVSNVWWAQNKASFNVKWFPPEVTTTITLIQVA